MATSWGLLAVKLYLIGSIYGMSFATMGPVIPRLRAELGLSNAVLGTLFTAVLIGFLVASVLSGALSARVGWKRALVGAGLVMVIGVTLFPLVRTFPLLATAAVMIGLGGGVLQPLSSSMLTSIFPGREGSVVNVSQVYFGVGAMSAPILIRLGVLIGSWRWAFLVAATLGWAFLLSLALAPFPVPTVGGNEESGVRPSTSIAPSGRSRLASASFIALTCAMFLYTATEVSFWGWLPTHLQGNLHASATLSGLSVTIFWTVFIGVRLIVGRATQRLGELRVIEYATAASAVLIAAFYFVSSPFAALVVGGVVAFFMAPIWPTLVAYTSIRFRHTSSSALGIVIGAGGLGGAVGPPVLAVVAEYTGMRVGFLLLAIPALLILMSAWLSHRFATQPAR